MLTNKLNLPEPIFRAAKRARYSKGDARYSVTELLKPPRLGALQRAYGDTIVEDVADHISALTGRMWHTLFEQSGAPETGAILEERLSIDIDGICVSGAMDCTLLDRGGILYDYKTTNVYSVVHGPKEEWIAQLNFYRLLRAKHGQAIEALYIIAYMRDWFIREAMVKPDKYPPHEIALIPIPTWGLDEAEERLRALVQSHREADEQLAREGTECFSLLCSREDQWCKNDVWAVRSPKRKTAHSLHESEGEAQLALLNIKDGWIEFRPGERTRCTYWCSVGRAGLCAQWNREREALAQQTPAVNTEVFD